MVNNLKLIRPDAQIMPHENTGDVPLMAQADKFTFCVLSFLKKHA